MQRVMLPPFNDFNDIEFLHGTGTRLPAHESTPHMKNWLECLRSRKVPNAPIEAGYAHSVAAILADEAYVRQG